MKTAFLASLTLLAPVAAAQTYAPPTWRGAPSEGHPPLLTSYVPEGGGGFQVVDQLGHQDDFWANSLVGDADHDGLQEIVLRVVPVGGGENRIVFYEDDGTGQFDEVHSFPLDDGGLLAMGDVDQDGLTDLFLERANGICDHEYVRLESESADTFPAKEVWSAEKAGNTVDWRGTIADLDGDGRRELIVSDNDFGCATTSLKVFEASDVGAAENSMNLILDVPIGGALGNPVVADIDLDGRREVVVAETFTSRLLIGEAVGDNAIVPASAEPHPLFNAYQLALIDRGSPDGRAMIFLAGQQGSLDYRVRVYESFQDNQLGLVNEELVPNDCGASIPQIFAQNVVGTRVPEIMLDRLCGPVPVYEVGNGGVMSLFDSPVIGDSLEIVATRKTPVHSGAIAIGTFPSGGPGSGDTLVLLAQE